MKGKKLIYSLSAITLTSSLMLSPLAVLADEEEQTETNEEEVEEVLEDQEETLEELEDELNEEVTDEDEGQEEANLVEQLFTYYGKLSNQLSIALEDGQVELAHSILYWSVEDLQSAFTSYQEGDLDAVRSVIEDGIEILEEAEAVQEDSDEEEESTEEGSEEEEESTEEGSEEDAVEEDELEEDEEETETKQIGQNVLSLANAMEDKKNPVAKAALKRNIERSLDRLEAKYGDISDLLEQLNEITDEFKEEEETDEDEEQEDSNEENNEEESSSSDEESENDSETEVQSATVNETEEDEKEESSNDEKEFKNNGQKMKEQNKENKPSKGKGKGNNGKGNNGKGPNS
ncbi:hypothetical protein [Alkalibacillus aidingensis]|uniref:hypothetical protein n=1 Tax=Alkalibacillus aidingensis TaxID=2747607 RepID=UPI001660A2CC|nr:hypothetical protein [Alkalibacillus aidingensis]